MRCHLGTRLRCSFRASRFLHFPRMALSRERIPRFDDFFPILTYSQVSLDIAMSC